MKAMRSETRGAQRMFARAMPAADARVAAICLRA
jgi:hypothetical protein